MAAEGADGLAREPPRLLALGERHLRESAVQATHHFCLGCSNSRCAANAGPRLLSRPRRPWNAGQLPTHALPIPRDPRDSIQGKAIALQPVAECWVVVKRSLSTPQETNRAESVVAEQTTIQDLPARDEIGR